MIFMNPHARKIMIFLLKINHFNKRLFISKFPQYDFCTNKKTYHITSIIFNNYKYNTWTTVEQAGSILCNFYRERMQQYPFLFLITKIIPMCLSCSQSSRKRKQYGGVIGLQIANESYLTFQMSLFTFNLVLNFKNYK